MKEYKYKINGNSYTVSIGDIEDNMAHVEVNGVGYNVELEEQKKPVTVKSAAPRPAAAPRTSTGEKVIAKAAPTPGNGTAVKAPLPGVVLSIPVKVGQTVKSSDVVLMLEAMKMENSIHAGVDGTVKEILVSAGDSVLEGNPLIVIG